MLKAGDENHNFLLNRETGNLYVARELDREATPLYRLSILATHRCAGELSCLKYLNTIICIAFVVCDRTILVHNNKALSYNTS